ncbi:MAG: 3-isopropylmalate dehydratase large subunit [Deltaproteobacteria bacterium]|nr:3-isopropylmalate dehydratase large subunit [Deltaproteobacteria bacterium]
MTPSPKTMAEKILARASGRDDLKPGDFLTARIDVAMLHEAFALCAAQMKSAGIEKVWDPRKVVVILDHFFPAPSERYALGHRAARALVEELGIEQFLGHEGVCHQVLTERALVRPGQLVVGTDSHSTTYGALGAAGAGIGTTDMTYVLGTGELWLQVPATIRFELLGELGPAVSAKDIVLEIAGSFGVDVGQYRSIEFGGPLAAKLGVSSRLTLANMGAELGAKFAMFEADAVALAYLAERGVSAAAFGADPGCEYEAVHELDVSSLTPRIALPHSPGKVRAVEELEGKRIDQAFLGSCTNARAEDLAIAAEVLRGHRVAPHTRLIVTPASREVALQATRSGAIETLLEAGASITAPGCGACPGGHGGVLASGEVCISSTNRNFRGRMGSSDAEIYLASPASVAAAAIEGRISDPRKYWKGRSNDDQ